MRRRWIFAAVAAALVLAAPTSAQTRPRPWLTVELAETQDADALRIRGWLEQSGTLQLVAAGFNRWVRMPRPITLRATECATSDVRWVPDQAAVEVCYRMGVRLGGMLTADSTRGAYRPALGFIIMHGMAHAVVDELNLPTPAGEEQAVDEVTALFMVPHDLESSITLLTAIRTLQRADSGWAQWEWVRTHQLTPERLENIACMAYGANPSFFRRYRDTGLVSAARAGGCAAAYNRVFNGLGQRISRVMN
jgi:hypothetical protein